jgi:photosystem II stability/assembly factor-like uncharacterized protein
VGWIIGGYAADLSHYNALLSTHDGGATWTRQNLFPLTLNGFLSIAPVSEQVVFALGVDPVAAAPGAPGNPAESRAVYGSTNGGTSWQQLPGTGFLGSFHLHFFTEKVGLSLKNQRIQRTTDGANSWNTVLNSNGTGDWNLLQFPGGDAGYAAGGGVSYGIAGGVAISKGALARTTDQGATWQILPWDKQSISSLSFVNATVGFAATFPDHNLYKTQDGGLTWVLTTEHIPAVFNGKFLTEAEGYFTEGPNIYATSDGGLTWQQDYQVAPVSQYPATINSLTFPTSAAGFAVTADGQVLKGTR